MLLKSFIAGVIVGIVFKWIKLPLPAPPVLSGILGIVGIFVGGKLIDLIEGLM